MIFDWFLGHLVPSSWHLLPSCFLRAMDLQQEGRIVVGWRSCMVPHVGFTLDG